MLVVHAAWSPTGGVCVWAEDATVPASAVRPGVKPKKHPFGASVETLRKIFDTGSECTYTLQLPSSSTGPIAAPELVRPAADTAKKLKLAPWTVNALALTPDEALRLLPEPPETPSGSWRWLAAVARYARSLVDRGQVLPGLVDGHARWIPQLIGEDEDHTRALHQAMPSVVRAEAADVLPHVLTAFTDATARARLDEIPLSGNPISGSPTAAQRWMRALTTPDARVDGDLGELGQKLRDWHRSAAPPVGPLRTCFRLALPDEDDDDWRVEFFLQATADPSLTASAKDVWLGKGAAQLLARHAQHPEEVLLAGLGRASRVYPELDAALRVSTPAGLKTDPEGAYRFLRQSANALTLAGFGVQLPTALQRAPELGLKLKASSSKQGQSAVVSGGLGLNEILDYQWKLAVGENELTDDEIAELAKAKAPLVRLRGRWVELDNARLRRALAFLEQSGEGEMTARDLLQADSALAEQGVDVPVTDVVADGWLGDVLAGRIDDQLAPVSTPDNFTATLRPYQERGLAWLSFLSRLGLGGCLADDMGLGKTVQLLALIAAEGSRPNLLVCPMSVVGNWQREAARFTPDLRVYVHHGSGRVSGAELAAKVAESDLVITTYGVVSRENEELAGLGWHRIVLDEAQNIKNSGSKQARAVRALPAAHRVALTGTPVENRLAELWSVMEFANPGLLGPATTFRSKFAVPIERDKNPTVTAALRRRTQPFILRRVKTDKQIISDLPDKIEMTEVCQLTAEQGSLYQAVVADMMERIENSEGMERRGLVLSTLSRLKQVCNHPAHLLKDGSRMPGRSGKLARLEEILDEALSEGDKVLCFTQFAEFGEMLRAHLTARFEQPVLFLHGGVTKSQRDAMVERFQTDAGPPIFVLSLKAGGVGLNLTAASHVVHVDRWWNPAVEDQATDRAFRIGQRRNVQVRKFICAGTVEDRIDAMIRSKKALAEMVVGSGEDWLTELSTNALRELFELAPDAVGEAA